MTFLVHLECVCFTCEWTDYRTVATRQQIHQESSAKMSRRAMSTSMGSFAFMICEMGCSLGYFAKKLAVNKRELDGRYC